MQARAGQLRVLVVDDDDLLRRLLCRLLERGGVNVICCSNGWEAVASLEETPVDMVVTDLEMPVMDGFELLAWVQAHRPEVRRLVISGNLTPAARKRCMRLGIERAFDKPLSMKELAAHVYGEPIPQVRVSRVE